MEFLILVIAPAMTLLIWCIWANARKDGKTIGFLALTFMAMAAIITSGVHIYLLTGLRAAAKLAFRWPSLAYMLDIVAWDLLFAISVLLAAPLVRGGKLARFIRTLLILSGLIAIVGLAGLPTGNMQLRNIGIVGYNVIFPAAAASLAVLFCKEAFGRKIARG
jgi:hypothetical protein